MPPASEILWVALGAAVTLAGYGAVACWLVADLRAVAHELQPPPPQPPQPPQSPPPPQPPGPDRTG